MDLAPLDSQAEFEDRLRFEMLLTELSARFVSVTAETIGPEIVNAQRQIVEALDLERSTLGRVDGGDRFVVTHSWALPGTPPLPGYAIKDLPWFSSVLSRGDFICYSTVDDLPEEAVREKEVVRRVGPRSDVTFPLKVGGKVIGAMGFGTVHGLEYVEAVRFGAN